MSNDAVRATGTRPRADPRREILVVFLVLSLAATIFLWKPISTGQWYAAGDVSGLSELTQSPDAKPAAVRQIDVTVDVLPWLKFNRDEVRSGHLPLWNPYNNSGVPHTANIQAAVFSPFTVPFYILPFRLALLVSAYLILIVAGMLMYGLMRHLRASPIAGVASSLTYMFSAFMVVWLRWPLGSVAAFIPGILWTSSELIRADDRRGSSRWGAAVAVLIALAIFAGHVETIFFGMFPVTLWCVAWLRVQRFGFREALRRFSKFVGAVVGGLCLGAVQVLPFLEYLSHSPASGGRNVQVFQSLRWASIHVFPFHAGSPAMKYSEFFNLQRPFLEIVILYVSGFSLALALLALLSWRWTRRRVPLFFAGMAGIVLLYIYDIGGLASLVSRLPIMSLVMPTRIAAVWALCIAVLAGFGIDAVRTLSKARGSRVYWPVILSCLLMVAVIVTFVLRAMNIYRYSGYSSEEVRSAARQTLLSHVIFIGITLAIGLLFVGVHVWARSTRVRSVSMAVMVAILFLQGGFLWRGYNVSVPKERFMAFPSRLQKLGDGVRGNQTLWNDDASLMPDVNLWDRLYSPYNYDALGLKSYDALYRALLRPPSALVSGGVELGMLGGPVDPTSTRSLQVMGIRRIVTGSSYPFVNRSWLGAKNHAVRPPVGQEWRFRWNVEPPTSVVVYTEDVPDGTMLTVTVTGDDLRGRLVSRVPTHGQMAVVPTPRDLPDAGVLAVDVKPSAGSPNGLGGGRILKPVLISSHVAGLRLLDSVDGFQLYAVPGPSGLASSPSRAIHVDSNRAARDRVLRSGFDPTTEVVVEGGDRSEGSRVSASPAGKVRIERNRPGDIRMSVTRATPGYVLVNQNDYPGWRATVDGRGRDVLRANSTYMAVRVPAGTSRVEFRFRPTSVLIGMILTLGTLVAGIAVLILDRWRTGQRRRRDRGNRA